MSKTTSAGTTTLSSFGYPFQVGTVMQLAARGNQIIVWIGSSYTATFTDSDLTGGAPGVYVRPTADNEGMMDVRLGPADTTAPSAVSSGSLKTSAFPSHVDLQWSAAADNNAGIGVTGYQVLVPT